MAQDDGLGVIFSSPTRASSDERHGSHQTRVRDVQGARLELAFRTCRMMQVVSASFTSDACASMCGLVAAVQAACGRGMDMDGWFMHQTPPSAIQLIGLCA